MKTQHAEAPADAALHGRDAPPRRILMVDDDADIRELNVRVLALAGYQVDAAADGADAWQALNDADYDLLVTDNNMPKVSGVELLEKLHTARMALPAIMATGAYPEAELNRRPWLQPFATLLKPYTPDQLLGTVHEALSVASGDPPRQAGPPS